MSLKKADNSGESKAGRRLLSKCPLCHERERPIGEMLCKPCEEEIDRSAAERVMKLAADCTPKNTTIAKSGRAEKANQVSPISQQRVRQYFYCDALDDAWAQTRRHDAEAVQRFFTRYDEACRRRQMLRGLKAIGEDAS